MNGEEVNVMAENLPMARVKTAPDICSYVDEDNQVLHLEVSLLVSKNKRQSQNGRRQLQSFRLEARSEYVTMGLPRESERPRRIMKMVSQNLGAFRDAMEDAVSVSIH
jgi:hypothetical protein